MYFQVLFVALWQDFADLLSTDRLEVDLAKDSQNKVSKRGRSELAALQKNKIKNKKLKEINLSFQEPITFGFGIHDRAGDAS